MKIKKLSPRDEHGSVLFNAVVYAGVLGIGCLALLSLGSYRVQSAYNRWDSNEAYYHAENVLQWGVQRIADTNANLTGQFSASGGQVQLPYLASLNGSSDTGFVDAWLTISNHPSGIFNEFLVTASAKVGNRVRTIQAVVQKNPPSQVFDYEYFLNNWGWWWGSTITGQGDNRANWDFDFRGNPTVNGSVTANGWIESNGTKIDPLGGPVPINGLAGTDPVAYLHDGSPRLEMPNLKDFTGYEQQAVNKGGKLYVGSALVVDAVHGNAAKPGLFLNGTAANPIRVDGPVVIPGDVVIKGPITGVGTLYVGGNLYIAGDLTYANGPDYSSPPELMSAASRDSWVKNNLDSKKDLVAFAVREAILGGQVNSTAWKSACYDPASYGLKNVGGEAGLGADGITGTPDDNVPFRDTNGDGIPDSAWYDADGDGVIDQNYSYTNQITMTDSRAQRIYNYPTNSSGSVANFNNHSTNTFNTVNGIFYCNHALAMRAAKANFVFNGALICRDEAIIFSNTAKFNYDSRIHSRYSNDPNRYIDLGLPIANKVKIKTLTEMKPVEGFYGTGG